MTGGGIVRKTILAVYMLCSMLAAEGWAASQRIAILPFEDKTKFKGPWDIVNGIPGVLAEKLAENSFYRPVPPESLATFIEGRKQRAGKFKEKEAIEIGTRVGADYVFTGKIIAFAMTRFRAGAPVGGYSSYGASAHLEVKVLSIIEGKTKGIITGEGDVTDRGVDLSYRMSKSWERNVEYYEVTSYVFNSSQFWETLIGEALAQALDQLKEKVEEIIEPPPVPLVSNPTILWVEEDKVYVNIGSDDGAEVGDKFGVYLPGEELKDPYTGESLGRADARNVGTIQIVAVKKPHLSKARILEGREEIVPNAMVRVEKSTEASDADADTLGGVEESMGTSDADADTLGGGDVQ